MADAYLGSWLLLPELCFYEFGPVPASGRYRIAERGRDVHVSIEWSMDDGEPQQTEYVAPPDGKPQAIDAPRRWPWGCRARHPTARASATSRSTGAMGEPLLPVLRD